MQYEPVARDPQRHAFWLSVCLANTLLLIFGLMGVIAQAAEIDSHEALFQEYQYPSASTCKSCHPQHYEEWSVSSHAYAQLSPISIAMIGKINRLTNGTNGDFCIRCHSPVGMNLGEPIFIPNADRHPTAVEGVTCVVCHRRQQPYGKVSGRLALAEGSLTEPVYGPNGNEELQRVIQNNRFGVTTQPGGKGREIHKDAIQLPQITTSGFCGSCHDVNLVTGIRLEEAFSEYKEAPAAKRGVSCQDCHMGKEPGNPLAGYHMGPAAIVGGMPTKIRTRTNHMFVGPDSAIVHPGIFPHNPTAKKLATFREWLVFDVKAGWGTDDFEDSVPVDYAFPERWARLEDRYEARAVIDENLELIKRHAAERDKLLRIGYQLGDIRVDRADPEGLHFRVEVRNGTDGHNVPTGFDAERVVFLQVTVRDANDVEVFTSGDLDPNGDVRDLHSAYVQHGELALDESLFSLQSRFLTRMVRGGEREQVLPVNYSPSPLPFIRPQAHSTLLQGRPRGARKHRQTIGPLDSKWPEYTVTSDQLKGTTGPYTANVKLIAGMVPVNLIHEVQDAGFEEYGMSARDVADAVLDAHVTLWERDIVLESGAVEHAPADGDQKESL